MAGLITDLNQSAHSMEAQQLGLQVTGNNLSNVNTANYARQSVILGTPGVQESAVGEVSMGVTATSIQEARDSFLDAEVTREISSTNLLQSQQKQLNTAQSALGEQVSSTTNSSSVTDTSNSTSGISSALNNFFDAFTNLAASPNAASAKQSVVQTAGTLAETINNADSQLSSLQGGITSEINQNVGAVNGLLQSIAKLNGQINQFTVATPDSAPNDLIDQRQGDLEQLAQYMNFSTSTIPNSNGQIEVSALDTGSNPVTLVSKTSVEGSGISFDGTNFSGGSPSTVLGLTGGSLQGDLTVSTGAIQTLRTNLANTASQLSTAVNTAYNPSGTGNNFFQAAPAAGSLLTVDPSLTATSLQSTATADAGANELALAVSNVANQQFSTASGDVITGTIGGYYSSAVTSLGQSIDGVQSQLSDQTAVQTMVQQQRNSVSGVNQDEELTNMMTYQRAFEAQARVINTVNDLLDVVVNGLFGSSVN
jgi:flagellar hook-associated protein 1 FlgK